MIRFLLIGLMILASQAAVSAQTLTTPGTTTITQMSSECVNLTNQIAQKRAAIAYGDSKIAEAEIECEAAHQAAKEWTQYAADNPMFAAQISMMVSYHLCRAVYWAGEIHDYKYRRTELEDELDALLQAYALAGC